MLVFRIALPAMTFMTLALAAGAQAQTTSTAAPDTPVIVTTGEAITKVVPDRAWVTVTSESRARSPREAQKRNAAAMSSVMQQLKTAGLAAEAIRTTSIDLQPEFDYANGRQTLRGYVARNSVEVRVDALARLGEILDLAVGSGASSLGGIRFDLQDRDAAERDALKRAVADARQRAEAAAAGAGVRIDRIVRIEEHRPSVIPPPRPVMRAMRAEQLQVETPVAPGELEIEATVTLTVAIRSDR
jgi:hypothetical protein